jgi:hypothetical protein
MPWAARCRYRWTACLQEPLTLFPASPWPWVLAQLVVCPPFHSHLFYSCLRPPHCDASLAFPTRVTDIVLNKVASTFPTCGLHFKHWVKWRSFPANLRSENCLKLEGRVSSSLLLGFTFEAGVSLWMIRVGACTGPCVCGMSKWGGIYPGQSL